MKPLKIAVINLTRMGDLLMTGPLIDHLRDLHPKVEIHLFAVTSHLPIAKGMNVDKIVHVNFNRLALLSIEAAKKSSSRTLVSIYREFLQVIKEVESEQYDLIVNASFTKISAILAWLLRGKVIGGMHLDDEGYRLIEGFWAQYFFAGNLNRDLNPFHYVDVLVGLSGSIEKRLIKSRMHYKIPDSAREAVHAKSRILRIPETHPRIILQCGASTPDKRWEAEKFGQVGRILHDRLGANMLLVGTEDEKPLAVRASQEMGEGGFILAGKTELPELAAWLESADLLITNDTGTMHLAQSVGTCSLVITLGAALSDETGPYGEGNIIVEPSLSCFPCNFRVNCPHFNCHQDISPEAVAGLAEEMITVGNISDKIPGQDHHDRYKKMRLWRTGFDQDGWWRKFPLQTQPPRRCQFAREVFREVWKTAYAPQIRPNGFQTAEVALILEKTMGSWQPSFADSICNEDLPSAPRLIQLGQAGEELARQLAILAEGSASHLSEIGKIGEQLAAIDRSIDDIAIVQEFWRPLMLLFQFARQNLPPGSLKMQAENTVSIYRSLQKDAKLALELMNHALKEWEILSRNKHDNLLLIQPKIVEKVDQPGINELLKRNNGDKSDIISFARANKPNGDRLSSLARQRFKSSKHHIILLVNNYFIQEELGRGFQDLGHKVTQLEFLNNPLFIRNLLETSLSADLLVTVNHLGFDQQGELASILQKINLPYVSWYVDRPGFILLDHEIGDKELAIIYTWERSTIDEIRRYGFENVEFLPLATDPDRFSPGKDSGVGAVRWIANSMVDASADWRTRAGINEETSSLFKRAVTLQLAGRIEALAALEMAAGIEGVNLTSWAKRQKLTYASAIALTATRNLRFAVANHCSPLGLQIYGDTGWTKLAPTISYRGEVEYPAGLPKIYRGGVHLNVTSFQMPTAVNQRVFDVPASGGILITDDQEDLLELFDVDRECITFTEAGEAADKAAFYLKNPAQGWKVTLAARKRILKEHTYRRRAHSILHQVKKRLGRMAVAVEGG